MVYYFTGVYVSFRLHLQFNWNKCQKKIKQGISWQTENASTKTWMKKKKVEHGKNTSFSNWLEYITGKYSLEYFFKKKKKTKIIIIFLTRKFHFSESDWILIWYRILFLHNLPIKWLHLRYYSVLIKWLISFYSINMNKRNDH